MTDHLYYDDARLTCFEARVVAREQHDGKAVVGLDRTAFYPTSGGQPFDTGTLNGISVTDVWEDDAGMIWHQVDVFPEGEGVLGEIDWQRRFDHMQQHTGQHMLSAAFEDKLHAATIGFHLSGDYTTIDLALPELSWQQAFDIERSVNQVVFEDRPVTVRTITQAQINEIPFRKPPQVEGDIRVILVDGYDASACGGTHVSHTGEIGLIKITAIERNKQGVRVTFLCGARALQHYQDVLLTAQSAGRTLSVAVAELPEAVLRLQDEMKTAQRAFRSANNELQAMHADRLWSGTEETGGRKMLALVWEEGTFDDLKLVVNRLRERPRTVILAAVLENKGLRLICARSEDLVDLDARTVFKRAAEILGVRGGGSPTLVQGGGPMHEKDDIVNALQAAFAE